MDNEGTIFRDQLIDYRRLMALASPILFGGVIISISCCIYSGYTYLQFLIIVAGTLIESLLISMISVVIISNNVMPGSELVKEEDIARMKRIKGIVRRLKVAMVIVSFGLGYIFLVLI